ncbi:MAG: ThuA domain-containing protein [Pirellulaceae bacterium]
MFLLNPLRSFHVLAVLLLLGVLGGPLCAAEPAASSANKRVKVLLVTGIEYHNWRETAPQIAKQLTSCADIEVTLETNFNVLCSDDIFKYDVLFFNFWNSKDDSPSLDDDLALSNIEKFLDSGKGIVVYHLAIGIFETHKDRVEQIIGRVYDRSLPGHDPFREFEVHVVKKDHPIMKAVPDFKIPDELYTCFALEGRPIEVLAEATSINVKKSFPMAYLHKYGKGQVFTTVLGHDLRALKSQELVTMLRNAVLWLGHMEIPAVPAQVVSPSKPIIEGRYYPVVPEELAARVRQVEQGLPPGEKLLVYVDCGREWDKSAPSGETISVEGDAYLFPGSRDVFESEPAFGYVVSGNPARLQIEGLRPEKKYKLFISWWDFDNGKRIQSVRLQTRDGSRSFPALKPTALPTYFEKNELGKTYSFEIPGEFVKAGNIDCLIELVQGPNAVISEAWLVTDPN